MAVLCDAVTAAHARIAVFRDYDRFSNLNNRLITLIIKSHSRD